MKIIYLASSVIPSRTANSVHVMSMCEALAQLGHEVLLATPNTPALELPGVADVHEFYGVQPCFRIHKIPFVQRLGGTVRNLTLRAGLARILRGFQPDLAYGRVYQFCAAAAARGIPTCFEMHSPLGRQRQKTRQCRAFLRSPQLRQVVVISEALRGLVLAQQTAPDPERLLVAHDAARPVEDFSARPAHWPARPGALQVGYAGSLYPGRGIDLILAVAGRQPDMDFQIMGGTPEEVRHWQGQCNAANVHFHGFVPTAEVTACRLACDVLLAPYQQKVGIHGGTADTVAFMSPLKVFEYMACARLLLVSDLPVLREVLDEELCMLLPPSDAAAWVAALDRARDPELRAGFGKRALERFTARHSWRSRAQSILAGLDF